MRVETNTVLIKRNRKIAQYLFFGSFAVLIGWLFISSSQMTDPNQPVNFFTGVVVPAVLLPAAFITSIISVRFTNLWVRQPRPEDVIRANLKGISPKAVLYDYYFFPARHVLIAPQGVYAMITRFQDGRYTVKDDVWKTHRSAISRIFSILRFDHIGDPTAEAKRAAAYVQKLIDPIAPNVKVHPLIVFVDPRAVVEVESSTVPIVYTFMDKSPSLKEFLREEAQTASKEKRLSLTPEQIAAFEAAALKR